ncbi:MAG: hypothetical protein HXX10_08440 [Rhodoplanes sp.]|uniref:transposase n=1 Tax=Rhodoplanes sp. TaxID=1968906 RepID=UPI001849E925|nr:transposase [Rhodoplanes sp.]NVO14050.1 hypothetical protein [Rhodoplanes sp.]
MMPGPVVRRRRSLRLKGYDYGQAGAYFVTICTQDRICLLGEPIDASVRLTDAGRMVMAMWDGLPGRFPGVEVDVFVVMPNHVHGIVLLADTGSSDPAAAASGATTRVAPTEVGLPVGAPLVGAQFAARGLPVGAPLMGAQFAARMGVRLGEVVGAFKSATTVEYIRGVKERGWVAFRGRLWQRNYYEHVVRDEPALDRIRHYIEDNPARWDVDDENPHKVTA